MANVLPLEEKKSLYGAYKRRVLIVSLGMLSVLILAAVVMLVPSLVIFSVKKETVTKQLEFLKQSEQVKVTSEALEEIKLTRERLKVLAEDQSIPMSTRIDGIVSKRPEGIIINSLIIPSSSLIEIRGEARNREVILAYVKALEGSPYVEKVDSPISNLVSNQGQFVVRITTKSSL